MIIEQIDSFVWVFFRPQCSKINPYKLNVYSWQDSKRSNINKRMSGKKSGKSQGKVTWAQAFRDIVIASMNKGQLPVLAVFMLIGLLIWKLPETEVLKLWGVLIDKLSNGELLSYPLLGFVTLGWFYHSRRQRRHFLAEYERIATEKSELQEKLTGTKLKSSSNS